MSTREFWLQHRPVTKTDLINQQVIVPAFSFNCGHAKGSVKMSGTSLSPLRTFAGDLATYNPSTGGTVEFYIKISRNTAVASYYVFKLVGGSGRGIDIQIDNTLGVLAVYFNTSVATYSLDTPNFSYDIWHRITVTFSSVDNLGRLYIDGTLAGGAPVATTGILDVSNYTVIFGDLANLSYLNANIADLRLYNVRKTAQEIEYNAFHTGSGDTTLKHLWKLNMAPTFSEFSPVVGGVVLTGSSATFDPNNYPSALKFGGSFVAAKYSADLAKSFSFQFPLDITGEEDHSLVVHWVDDEGIHKRRYFYKPSGVDYDQNITEYQGERVNSPFDLEIWNIDGAATANLEEELEMKLSVTSAPLTAIDRSAITAANLAVDSTLAAPFPLTPFPLVFNTQQTYN